ncbi:MAG: 6-carboxytetrahydropterin synthase [Planctomycetes bacterium]|nr:6-carboxytetrahydropterin synthase [Planctomycetota bacterium]
MASGTYEITIEKIFAASHAIRLPDGSLEPIHGHNWPVEVTVAAAKLDSIECVMDFHVLEKTIDALIGKVHNRHLNEVAPFIGCKVNPTAERVAWWFGSEVAKTLPKGVKLVSVRVGEAPGCYATYRP